jgi:hypothetical protein
VWAVEGVSAEGSPSVVVGRVSAVAGMSTVKAVSAVKAVPAVVGVSATHREVCHL